jgi:V8-like Glu-specific endopeptidase
MSIALQHDDFRRLVNLLQDLPDFANVRDRERLVAGALEGSPRARDIRGGLDLDGNRRGVAVEVITNLARFGQVAYGKEALGVFLNELLDLIGEDEDADFIRALFSRYPLDQPAARHRPLPLDQWRGITAAEDIREKIIGEDTLRDIAVLELALAAARSVVRVGLPSGAGSGFMVAPGLLMTNHHVIDSPQAAARADFAFDYQLDRDGKACEPVLTGARPNGLFHTHPELDYTVVQLEDPPPSAGHLSLRPSLVKKDQRVSIIQHPGGHFKKISMQNNFVAYADQTVVQYFTATMAGSSGSPVLNDEFEVVAIHHSGGMLEEPGTGRRYLRNAGTSMIAVLADLRANAPAILAKIQG